MGYYILLPPFIPLFKWRMEPRIEVWPATLCPAQSVPSLHIGGRGGNLPTIRLPPKGYTATPSLFSTTGASWSRVEGGTTLRLEGSVRIYIGSRL